MLKIYNSLSRRIEDFKPINPPNVGVYTCGPTVYLFAHIGNLRAYSTSDLLVRVLKYNNYEVKFIMNITDVGHMTNDQTGGADTGEDKIEKAAKNEGKTVWEIAEFYTNTFLMDYKTLNYTLPDILAKATDHIKDQIELILRLEKKGYTYTILDGVYFDSSKFKNYGRLSNLDQIKEGARVEINPDKKNPHDFALWKFSYPDGRSFDSAQDDVALRRQMEWESPWGLGFPGWHIECSAMSMKYLGETFDIHTGGVDHKEIHHPNEIAQSEGATGKKFVNYWIHTAFMLVSGEKMSKSLGNIYRLYDLEKKGYDPLALRYLYLQTHYRQEMNFTFTALDAAQNALAHLRDIIIEWGEPQGKAEEFEKRFLEAINNDLNLPESLSVVWDLVKSTEPSSAKMASLLRMDKVLGLDLATWKVNNKKITVNQLPRDVQELIAERFALRKNRQFTKADHLRNRIKKLGYDIVDGKKGLEIKKI
jgi:cysteinyl-tRNA synthetase